MPMILKYNTIINNKIGCYETLRKQKKSESTTRVPYQNLIES